MNHTNVCDICQKESDRSYGAIIRGLGFRAGHRDCISPLLEQWSYMRFGWTDGQKGGYSPGWLNDVKRRKVVAGGEVVRDYGRKYFL